MSAGLAGRRTVESTHGPLNFEKSSSAIDHRRLMKLTHASAFLESRRRRHILCILSRLLLLGSGLTANVYKTSTELSTNHCDIATPLLFPHITFIPTKPFRSSSTLLLHNACLLNPQSPKGCRRPEDGSNSPGARRLPRAPTRGPCTG